MLGLVRTLNEGNDAVIAALKAEGSLLDTRILNQRTTDNNLLRERRQQQDYDLERLRQTLDTELTGLKKLSAKRISKLIERDPTRAKFVVQGITSAAASSSPNYNNTTTNTNNHNNANATAPTAPTAEKVVDFWRGKQEASLKELATVEAQLASVRSKIEDVRTVNGSDSDGDANGAAKLMCMIGALRQKLQQARARTRDYQRLLSSIEEVALPRSQHAALVAAAAGEGGGRAEKPSSNAGPSQCQSDYDQEALALCQVESSLVNELECARAFVTVAQQRKEVLDSRIAFFTRSLEEGDMTLPEAPLPQIWPSVPSFEAPISEEYYLEVTEKERRLEEDRASIIRERRVAMLRELSQNVSTMDRWIEKQRLMRLSEHTERHVDAAAADKAALLFRIDETAAHAKVSANILKNASARQ